MTEFERLEKDILIQLLKSVFSFMLENPLTSTVIIITVLAIAYLGFHWWRNR